MFHSLSDAGGSYHGMGWNQPPPPSHLLQEHRKPHPEAEEGAAAGLTRVWKIDPAASGSAEPDHSLLPEVQKGPIGPRHLEESASLRSSGVTPSDPTISPLCRH